MRSSTGVLLAVLAAATAQKLSFIVFNIDDAGIDQVNVPSVSGTFAGYSGDGGKIQTPNIAKLGAEGMVFQNWLSSFHVCSPSRASHLTGRYSVRSGIGIPNCKYAPTAPGDSGCNMVLSAEAIGGLPLNETTTAEALKGAGYATGMVGKWHLGQRPIYMPFARGFDHYLGLPASQDMGMSLWETLDWKGKRPYQPAPLALFNDTEIIEQPADLGRLNERYANFSVDFIRSHAAAGEPFYLYVAFNHVHQPSSAGPAFCGSSAQGPVGDAMQEVDHAVGLIMAAATASGADILTFLISDNGAPLGADKSGNLPLRGGKTMVWEGGFREPGIVHWPGKVAPGTTTRALASSMDVHPTLLTLAGVPLPTDRIIDGLDLTPLITNASRAATPLAVESPDPLGRDTVGGHTCIFYYQAAVASNASDPDALSAVRCGSHKAYWYTNGVAPPAPHKGGLQDPPLLFDVEADVGEDLPIPSNSSEYAQVMTVLTAARNAHLATITPVPDQNARGSNYTYTACSDFNSKTKYPEWPTCTLTPETWQPAEICGDSTCVARFRLGPACKGPK